MLIIEGSFVKFSTFRYCILICPINARKIKTKWNLRPQFVGHLVKYPVFFLLAFIWESRHKKWKTSRKLASISTAALSLKFVAEIFFGVRIRALHVRMEPLKFQIHLYHTVAC